RDPGILRLASSRAAARRQPRDADDGAAPGDAYAPVRVGEESVARARAASAADLPARGRRRRDRLGCRTRPTRNLRPLETVTAIVRNKIAPGLGDWYLARTGYASQQTDEPETPGRPDNLWQPLDDTRDFGAHGRFGDRATGSSAQAWFTEHRRVIGAAAL